MGCLEKFSEAIAVVGQKKEAIENIMKLMMCEWAGVQENFKTIRDLSAQAVGELDSKQKHSKAVVESVKASYDMLNSKKMSLEEGLKKLDEKYKLVRGVLKDVEQGQGILRNFMDQQFKELALKEHRFQDLSETLKITSRHVEERKNELDLIEKALNGRKDEMDLRQEQLQARELKACAEHKMLKKMQQEIDAEKKRLNGELELRKAALVEQESLIASKERTLVERESEFAQKQKICETELESRKASLVERECLIASKELNVDLKEKLLEKRENLLQSKVMSNPREKIIHQPDDAPGICMEENKRGFGDGSAGEVLVKDSLRRDSKRRRSGDELTEHIKDRHPKHSGSDEKLQTKASEEVVILDDSESDSEVRADLVLKDTQKRELVRHYNVGETWACFDANDRMPRTYVKILGVTEQGENVRLQVEWMKPLPTSEGEKEWISAGLPVGCGTFEPSRKSVAYPRNLFQPIFSAGNPCIIVPFIGETWAIYKDWNLKTWSSSPDMHKRCKYEICEILPYSQCGSSSVAVRVAYLDKVRGSTCSFQRRSKKEEDSFFVQPNSLYRFSHRVPSSKSSGNVPAGMFELDQNALPPGL